MARGRKTSLTLTLTPRNDTRCSRGNVQPPSVLVMPDAGGLFYSWLRVCPSPTLLTKVGLNRRFIYKWVKRFLHERIAGLTDLHGRGIRRHAA